MSKMCKIKGRYKALDLPKTDYVLSIIKAISCFNKHVFIVKNTFAERNKTFCDKTLNKCIAYAIFFRILLL